MISSLDVDICTDVLDIFPDVNEVFNEIKRLDNVVWGIRWLDCVNGAEMDGIYDKDDTDHMFNMLEKVGATNMTDLELNFFIRSHYVHRSRNNIMDLFNKLKRTNPVSITIRSDEQYHVSPDSPDSPDTNETIKPTNFSELDEAIAFFGYENVYLQVTDEIRFALKFNKLRNQQRLN